MIKYKGEFSGIGPNHLEFYGFRKNLGHRNLPDFVQTIPNRSRIDPTNDKRGLIITYCT